MSARPSRPRVLAIAGSDPSGGAGIQADLKSIAAFGGYGMAAITALTAQNTRAVDGVHAPPAEFVADQLRAVSDDIAVDAVKIGMLFSAPIVEVVADWVRRTRPAVVVLDPVMISTSGHRLLDAAAERAVLELASAAHLITPNLDELAALVGAPRAASWSDALDQGRRLSRQTGARVVVKGGHLPSPSAPDALVNGDDVYEVPGERVESRNTHGTGCSLSAALATVRADGATWEDGLAQVKAWLTAAIRAGERLWVGSGNGPIDHLHALDPRTSADRENGSWERSAWDRGAAVRADILAVAFVRGMADGSLHRDHLAEYLRQDAHYLAGYGRVLRRLAELAPTTDDRAFWAASAEGADLEVERLHRRIVGEDVGMPAPVTVGYLDHLERTAARGDYAETVAAVLPCFTVYADLGRRFAPIERAGHPYAEWLDAYGDPQFLHTSVLAESVASRVADSASHEQRRAMERAHDVSLIWERDFFDEAWRGTEVSSAYTATDPGHVG